MATTTNYSWTTPNDSDPFKQGASAIRTLGSAVDTTLYTALGGNYPGLRLVKKQTIGSAVPSVTVTSAFSATYENYKVIVSGGVGSTATAVAFQFSGSATNYSNNLIAASWGGSVFTVNPASTSFYYACYANTLTIDASIEINSPFLAKPSTMYNTWKAAAEGGAAACYHSTAVSYTGFVLTPVSGTLTGGTIYVYGYGAS